MGPNSVPRGPGLNFGFGLPNQNPFTFIKFLPSDMADSPFRKPCESPVPRWSGCLRTPGPVDLISDVERLWKGLEAVAYAGRDDRQRSNDRLPHPDVLDIAVTYSSTFQDFL